MCLGSGKRRVPVQLYILVSFVPWILYWVLTGFNVVLGVVLALVSSLAIVFIELFRRGLGLMYIATALYFVVAFMGVLVLA